MARALMNAAGRAMRVGSRAQTVGCSDCCGPQPPNWFYQACPCLPGDSCAIPTEPCIYVDSRSIIGGLTGIAIEALNGSIIRVDGICYTLAAFPFGRCYRPEDAPDALCLIPDGAVTVGGPGVTIELRENCVDGCAEVNVGPEYFEAFRCSGCPIERRYFVCARKVGFWNVIYDNFGGETLCVDRSVGYTLAEVLAFSGDVEVIDEPEPVLVWEIGPSGPRRAPAGSCCFVGTVGGCGQPLCLAGQMRWWDFGGNDTRWFPVDTCCGTRAGLSYNVVLGFSRIQVQDLGGGDLLTTTITASVSSVVPVGGFGGVNVNLAMTNRQQRPSQGIDITTTNDATIYLEPWCCLDTHPELPRMIRFEPNENAVEGEPGYYYSTRFPIIEGTAAEIRRAAWQNSPWGLPLQLAPMDDGALYSSTGTTVPPYGCGAFLFQHTETASGGLSGTISVSINLVVEVLTDSSPPCSNGGPCGPLGWGNDPEGDLP